MGKQMHTTVLENNLIIFAVEEGTQVSLPVISLGGWRSRGNLVDVLKGTCMKAFAAASPYSNTGLRAK